MGRDVTYLIGKKKSVVKKVGKKIGQLKKVGSKKVDKETTFKND